jgi:hypothetical protein
MKSSYLIALLPLAVAFACSRQQEIQSESGGIKPSPSAPAPADATDKALDKAKDPVPVDSGSPGPKSKPIADPGGLPGYPFLACTAGLTGCSGKVYDTCSTVPVVLCPMADKFCRAVVASPNTCMSGETKSCPGNGISVCEVGPVDPSTNMSPCGWGKCKHCGAVGEPCCNPPAVPCAAGRCSVVGGLAYPTCN